MREQSQAKEKLVLVGDASFGYDETNYMINEFLLNNEVVMPGWIEEEDMPYVYSGAAAFVFPSNYEGFGIPLLQAMACHIPIAASRASSIPEVVDKAAILFDPFNVRSIAEALREIISNESLRRNLIQFSQERIKNFSWEKTAKQTLALLNRMNKY